MDIYFLDICLVYPYILKITPMPKELTFFLFNKTSISNTVIPKAL